MSLGVVRTLFRSFESCVYIRICYNGSERGKNNAASKIGTKLLNFTNTLIRIASTTASFVQHGRLFIRFWGCGWLWIRWTSLSRLYGWGAPGKEKQRNSRPENNRPLHVRESMPTGGVLVDDVYLCQQRRNAFIAPRGIWGQEIHIWMSPEITVSQRQTISLLW